MKALVSIDSTFDHGDINLVFVVESIVTMELKPSVKKRELFRVATQNTMSLWIGPRGLVPLPCLHYAKK